MLSGAIVGDIEKIWQSGYVCGIVLESSKKWKSMQSFNMSVPERVVGEMTLEIDCSELMVGNLCKNVCFM